MAINVKKIGALSRSDLLWFDPDELDIVVSKDHPLYDERVKMPVAKELVANIKTYGVLEPVIGRFNPDTGKTEVVDGRQRVYAARIAKEQQSAAGEVTVRVPVVMRRDDDNVAVGIMISANEQRKEDTIKIKARKANRMFAMGMSIGEVANAFGVTNQTIKNWTAAKTAKEKPKSTRSFKSKKVIEKLCDEYAESNPKAGSYEDGYQQALRWVLGKDNG